MPLANIQILRYINNILTPYKVNNYLWGYLKDINSQAIIMVLPVNTTHGKKG